MKNNFADLLTANFRDNGHLPLVGNLSSKLASFFSVGVYAVALVTFIVSFVSYSTFDSLKNQVTTISTTPGSNCILLSTYTAAYSHTLGQNAQDPVSIAITSFGSLVASNLYLGIDQIQYLKVYFLTYDACVNAFASNPYSISTVSLSKGPGTCYVGIFVFNINFLLNAGFTPAANVDICPSISVSNVTEAVFSVFNGNVMCSPFKNNPPYQCTTLQPLPTLNILSQSLALTTSAIAALFFVAALLVKVRAKPEPPVTKLDSVSSEIHDGRGGDRYV